MVFEKYLNLSLDSKVIDKSVRHADTYLILSGLKWMIIA